MTHLRPKYQTQSQRTPTFKIDSIYEDIFSRNPRTLFVLKFLVVAPHYPFNILDLLGPTYTYRVLEPFFQLRGHLKFPFPDKDSPIDFLGNPLRAMELYSPPHDIAEALVLLAIRRVKDGFNQWNPSILTYL